MANRRIINLTIVSTITIIIVLSIAFERWANSQVSQCLVLYLKQLEQYGLAITNSNYQHSFCKATNNFTVKIHNIEIPISQKISIGPLWWHKNSLEYGLARIETYIDGRNYGGKQAHLNIHTKMDFQKKLTSTLSEQLLKINFNNKSLAINIKKARHTADYPFLKQQQTLIINNIHWLAKQIELSKIILSKTKLVTNWELSASGKTTIENILDINNLQILDLPKTKNITTSFTLDFVPTKPDINNTKIVIKNLLFNLSEHQTLALQGNFINKAANINFKLSEHLVEQLCATIAKKISKGLPNNEIEFNKNMLKQLIVKSGFVRKEDNNYLAETTYNLQSQQLVINNYNISELISPYLNNFATNTK